MFCRLDKLFYLCTYNLQYIMPYQYEESRNRLSLSDLNGLVRQTIELTMRGTYWVEAELASVRESRGHCYMELVEKDEYSHTPIAQARACCWANTWMRLAPKFERATGESLHSGMKLLLLVKASFHEAYGFSWVVNDIDPTYTMGDMARRRQEILRQLREEGVIDLNKELQLSRFAQRIAVVSSATAAGYGDFCNQLCDNDFGFIFTTQLFPAIMQGERVEESVIASLEAIYHRIDEFDAVVIIRGGGSTADLSGFDTLALAENVANFPLPVITGIGHDRDQSVLDIVACVSMKTPTAVAAFLIDNLANTLEEVSDGARRIVNAVTQRMQSEKMRLDNIEKYMQGAFTLRKTREEARLSELQMRMQAGAQYAVQRAEHRLSSIEQRLPSLSEAYLQKEKYRVGLLSQRITSVDPINILRRGYSIAMRKGKAVKGIADVKAGDRLQIVLPDGTVETIVQDTSSVK